MRLFTAVCFDERTKDRLCGTMQNLKKHLTSGNFTTRDNLHLTLVFIGETSREKDIRRAMDQVSSDKFELCLGGLGSFRRDRGRIYWIGVRMSKTLDSIQHQLTQALREDRFPIEERPYKPHLTLARDAKPEEAFQEKLFSETMPEIRLKVSKISLMKSERIAGKLVYTEIYAKSLKPQEEV